MECPHADHRFDHHQALTEPERYGRYEEIRECPVAWSGQSGGFWILSRFGDVSAAAEDWRTYSSADGVLLPAPAGRRARQVALEQDPPQHTVYRRLYADLLSRARVREVEPFIRSVAAARLADLAAASSADGADSAGVDNAGRAGVDFVSRVAAPVPIEALARLLGLDPEVTGQLRDLTVAELAHVHRPGDTAAARPERTLMDLLREQIDDRRRHPRDDFVTQLTREDLPPVGLLSFLVGAVIAGHETTLIASANLALQLASDPALQARLRAEPALIPRVVDESLRHRSPVQNFVRTVTHDVEQGGVTLEAGSKVMLLFGAANRDPAAYPDPDRFDPDRFGPGTGAPKHLAFGWGVHRCVGAYLAEAELRILVEELGRYELTLRGEPRFVPTTFGAFLTIDTLPVSLDPVG